MLSFESTVTWLVYPTPHHRCVVCGSKRQTPRPILVLLHKKNKRYYSLFVVYSTGVNLMRKPSFGPIVMSDFISTSLVYDQRQTQRPWRQNNDE